VPTSTQKSQTYIFVVAASTELYARKAALAIGEERDCFCRNSSYSDQAADPTDPTDPATGTKSLAGRQQSY
jgi:hypothetical protein